MKKLIVVLFLLCISINVFADAGPPIPIPQITLKKAVELAEKNFYEKWKNVIDGDYFQIEDYIIQKIEYTKYFREEERNEWAWYIRFVHPVANDHSVTYKITNSGEVYEQEFTE